MRTINLWSRVALIAALTVFLQWAVSMNASAQQIEFNFDTNDGLPLARGQTLNSITVDGLTMGIQVDRDGDLDEAMIFDTSNPGTADPDLGTPNETCPNPPAGGWPGVGAGGVISTTTAPNPFENCESRGNVLIIPEVIPFDAAAGPDDYSGGGIITLTFDVPIRVLQIDILDIDEPDEDDRILQLAFLDASGVEIPFVNADGENVTELRPKVAGDNGYEVFLRTADFTSSRENSVRAIRGTFVGSGALANIVVLPNPAIALRKFVNGFDANRVETAPVVDVGTPLTWTYWVTNTGQASFPRATITVTDTDPTVTPTFNQVILGNADEILDPGEVWEYIDTGIMPDPGRPDTNGDKQDCRANESELPNDGYINGSQVTVGQLSADDIAIACPPPPGIRLRKFVNGFDANTVGTAPVVDVGAPLTWTYWVTNTGQTSLPLATITVTDTDPAVTPTFNQVILGNADANLDPGEVWEYIDTGIMPDPGRPDTNGDKQDCRANESELPNDGYINGSQVTVGQLSADDIAIACPPPPGIRLRKFVNGFDANTVGTAPVVDVGAPLTWTYWVTNTGQVSFPGATVTVTDTDPAVAPTFNQVILGNADENLDPGEVWEYIDTGIMPDPGRPDTNGDKQDCRANESELPNDGYINGSQVTVGQLSDSDIAIVCPSSLSPGIAATRTYTYELSYTVNNPPITEGGVPLESILVQAASPAVTISCPKTALNPGESMTCSATATDIAFRNSLGWVAASPVGGGSPIIRVVTPNQAGHR